LRPGSLISLRQINTNVSPGIERSIFQALAMHPTERPANAREMRDLLLGSKQALPTLDMPLPKAPKASWGKVLQHNRVLIGAVFVLLIIATFVSIIPPPFP